MKNKLIKRGLIRYYNASIHSFWSSFDRFYRKQGFEQLYFTLSFDCDRDLDAEASVFLARQLNKLGIVPTFAIPGVQIQRAKQTYLKLLNYNVEFMNHGGAAHTRLQDGKFISINYYDELSLGEIENDIINGHEIVSGVFKMKPIGFRAPHFGSYEENKDLTHLYSILSSLNYQYTSTTTPWHLVRWPKLSSTRNLREFPVTGELHAPFRIMDSWEHAENKFVDPRITDTYYKAIQRTVDYLVLNNLVGHINIYCDPSHVIETKYFNEAISYLLEKGLRHASFNELMALT